MAVLCPKCGYYSETEDSVCPECGEILNDNASLPTQGAEAIRQGKRARTAILDAAARQSAESRRRRRSGASHATVEKPVIHDEREDAFPVYSVSETESGDEGNRENVFERRRRTVYDENTGHEDDERAYAEWIGQNGRRRFGMVNWMKASIIAVAAVALIAVGGWLYLKHTDSGQKILARIGREANSAALWSLGEEQMNSGDLESAIKTFEKAKYQDEKQEQYFDVDGLLMLCSAYEAVGRTDAAAELYERIYEDTPARPEAYINLIRILRNSGTPGDMARAAELMKKAYISTGETVFQTQRSDLVPKPPKVNHGSSTYQDKIYLEITSEEGYDVYYTFDDEAQLPYGGILYTEPILLYERTRPDPVTWNMRAVVVNGELVSDEIKGFYKIIMPSPQMPTTNLAPGAYKTRQKVHIRPGKDNKDEDIRIFYTVDGSIPDGDSPQYKGEAILLPTGRSVTIRAIAVNKYNKQSNVMEYTYRIDAKPYPLTAWELDETIAGLELNKTTMSDFQAKYGSGTRVEMEQPETFEGECRKYEYPWGYAVMTLSGRNWILVELYFKDETFKAPRGTGTGDPMDYVVSTFRDMGQLESASGNRGLYHLSNLSDGKIYYDQTGKTWRIMYRIRKDLHWYRLEYFTDENGTVIAVDWQYIPRDVKTDRQN